MHGIPILVLDLISSLIGVDIVKAVSSDLKSKQPILRLNPDNEQFNKLKNTLQEDMLEFIFDIFNDLGAVDFAAEGTLHKDWESFQYISYASMKANFHKVFGESCDPMAELMFRYLTD